MTIQLTKEEALRYFHSALCNGLQQIALSGISIAPETQKQYEESKHNLQNLFEKGSGPEWVSGRLCYEDVYMQVLVDGKKLVATDREGSLEKSTITLDVLLERISNTPSRHLLDMENGNDDAITATAILETVFYGKVIFA